MRVLLAILALLAFSAAINDDLSCRPTFHSLEYLEERYPITFAMANKVWLGSCHVMVPIPGIGNDFDACLQTTISNGAFYDEIYLIAPFGAVYFGNMYVYSANGHGLPNNAQCVVQSDPRYSPYFVLYIEEGENIITASYLNEDVAEHSETFLFSNDGNNFSDNLLSYNSTANIIDSMSCYWSKHSDYPLHSCNSL